MSLRAYFDEESACGSCRGACGSCAARRGGVEGFWEDAKAAVVRIVQPGVDTLKAPVEEAATRAAKGGATAGIVIGGLGVAGVLGVIALVRRRR